MRGRPLTPSTYLRDGGQGGGDGGGELLRVMPPRISSHGQDEWGELCPSPWRRAERRLALPTKQWRVGGGGGGGAGASHAAAAVAGVTAGCRLQGGVTERGVQRLAAEGGRQGGGGAEGRLQ